MSQIISVKSIPKNPCFERIPVFLRMDLDVPESDNSRLEKSISTIELLLNMNYSVIIGGHKGRPKGNGFEEKLSLYPVYLRLQQILNNHFSQNITSTFINDICDPEVIKNTTNHHDIVFVENLRFDPREKKGDTSLYNSLKEICHIFINDAFAVAHRGEASVLLHKEMLTYYGFDFVEEYSKLEWLQNQNGFILILGGAKEDKLEFLIKNAAKAGEVLIGGKLPTFRSNFPNSPNNVFWAELKEDLFDLSPSDIEIFKNIIRNSNIVVWAGPLGFFEKPDCQQGTLEVAKAIIQSNAYIVTAGGDTSAALKCVTQDIDNSRYFPCCGGGALLSGLANFYNLPAWN